MSETQFYVLCAIPLVGILLNGGLFRTKATTGRAK